MKVGDTLFFGQYREKIERKTDDYFVAEAWIEKHCGFYLFYATWTFPTKESRPFIMCSGKFKTKNSEIIFIDDNKESVKSFSLVCRYLHCILKSFSKKDCHKYFKKGTTPLLMGVRVNKDWIGYEKSLIDNDIKKCCYLNYSKCEPHQVKAIVAASMALGIIDFSEKESLKV